MNKENLFEAVKVDYLNLTISELAEKCQTSEMIISQVVSELVCEKQILAVVLHPIKRQYVILPESDRELLDATPDSEFSRIYSKLKKKNRMRILEETEPIVAEEEKDIMDQLKSLEEWMNRPSLKNRILSFISKVFKR